MGKYDNINPLDKLHESDGWIEPYFWVRAQDRFALGAIRGWAEDIVAATYEAVDRGEDATKLQALLDDIEELGAQIRDWQESNADLVKIPD